MSLKAYNIDVPITPGVMPPVIHIAQYDSGREYIAHLKNDDGTDYIIPANATATFTGCNPRKEVFEIECNITNNAVIFVPQDEATSMWGLYGATINITSGGEKLSPLVIKMDVQKAGATDEEIAGAANFPDAVTEAVDKWMEEHGPPAAIETDPTLSQPGQAADAKAAGDAIDRVFYPSAKFKLLEVLRSIGAWNVPDAAELIDELESELFPEGDIVAISAAYTQSGTVQAGDDLDSLRADLVVTATMSDSSTRAIRDYTLTGTLSTGTSTITVKYRDLTDTFSVTVSAAPTEVSITAYYTQGQTEVTPYTPLVSLKSNMTVMVNFSDTTRRELDPTEYTLSGTLAEGTSYIDVAYNGFTDEIIVTVSAAPAVPTGFDADGLICCLDGKQINDNLWYNLVSGIPFVLQNVTVETDGVTFAGNETSIAVSDETFASGLTIEVVYKAASDSGNYNFFGQHQESGSKNLALMHSKSSGKIFSNYNTASETLHIANTVQTGILSATKGNLGSPAQIAVLNGVEITTTGRDYMAYPAAGITGSRVGSASYKGEILMVCIFNKRKTAAEMIANQAVYDSYYSMGVINAQS